MQASTCFEKSLSSFMDKFFEQTVLQYNYNILRTLCGYRLLKMRTKMRILLMKKQKRKKRTKKNENLILCDSAFSDLVQITFAR